MLALSVLLARPPGIAPSYKESRLLSHHYLAVLSPLCRHPLFLLFRGRGSGAVLPAWMTGGGGGAPGSGAPAAAAAEPGGGGGGRHISSVEEALAILEEHARVSRPYQAEGGVESTEGGYMCCCAWARCMPCGVLLRCQRQKLPLSVP